MLGPARLPARAHVPRHQRDAGAGDPRGGLRAAEAGVDARPEIMIPLVGHVNELNRVKGQLEQVAQQVMAEQGVQVHYKFGTMIEVPARCPHRRRDRRSAEFFSFGTNDLTQMTFAYSRDDAEGKFLARYLQEKILPENPFQTIDTAGVGKLDPDGRRGGP